MDRKIETSPFARNGLIFFVIIHQSWIYSIFSSLLTYICLRVHLRSGENTVEIYCSKLIPLFHLISFFLSHARTRTIGIPRLTDRRVHRAKEKTTKLKDSEKFCRYNIKVSRGEKEMIARIPDKRSWRCASGRNCDRVSDAFDRVSLILFRFSVARRGRDMAVIEFHGFAIISKVHDRR